MIDFIGLAVTFLILALIAYVLGARGFVIIFGMVSYIFFLVLALRFLVS